MLNIKDIANGLAIAKTKSHNTDLFSGDKTPIEISDLKGMTNYVIDETDKNSYTRVARLLSIDEDMVYLTVVTQTVYQSDRQIIATIQPLTPQGMCYYYGQAKVDEPNISLFDAFSENYLRDNYKLNVTMEDLRLIAQLNTEYDVFMIEFETSDSKYWITLSSEGLLKKVTVRPTGQTVMSAMQSVTDFI